MLRFVDPNSVTFKDNRDTTFALFEAAERGYVEIMKVMLHTKELPFICYAGVDRCRSRCGSSG